MVIFWDLFSVVLPVLGQFMSNMHGLCNRIYFQGKNAFMWLPWWSSGWDSELPVQGVHVQCMVRELRFCKPRSKAEEKKMHWDGAENWICNSVALRMKSACHRMVTVKKKQNSNNNKKTGLMELCQTRKHQKCFLQLHKYHQEYFIFNLMFEFSCECFISFNSKTFIYRRPQGSGTAVEVTF